MGLSTFQIEEWMDLLQAKDVWAGIFYDDPFLVGDPLTVEWGGATYARPQITWSRPSPVLLRHTNPLRWQGLTQSGVVLAIGGFDAPTNGNLLFGYVEDVATPLMLSAAGSLTLPAQSLYVGIDG